MPTFFADPPVWLYLVLAVGLVLTGGVAAQYQDRRTAIPFGIAFLLMLIVFLFDRTNESPREQAVCRTHQMAMAVDAKNPDAFAEHVADTVLIQGTGKGVTLTREELKTSPFWITLKAYNVSVAVWDFARDDVKELDANTVEIGFLGKGTPQSGAPIPVYLRATFARQSDGSFKLAALRTFEPLDRTKPLTIPGFF